MRLAVIGDPIAHSLSPAIHRAVFAELGIPLEYSAHRVEKGRLDAFTRFAVAEKIDGFNVTMPHKTDILPFCANVHAKAVNTVALREGILRGYSTDEKGFLLSLAERGFSVRGKQAVIAGRGGVAATLSEALINEGADAQCISVRNGVSLPQGRAAGLFINATPLGMEGCPEDWKDLSFLRKLPKDAAVYDLIYNPRKTRLLREAEALGLTAINGLDMLIYQAILSDEIYLGKELDKAGLKGKAEKLINTHLF